MKRSRVTKGRSIRVGTGGREPNGIASFDKVSDHLSPSGGRLSTTQSEIVSEDPSSSVSSLVASDRTSWSPKPLDALQQVAAHYEARSADSTIPTESDDELMSIYPKIIERLVRPAVAKGYITRSFIENVFDCKFPKISARRKEQLQRKAILDEASRSRPFKSDKPLPRHRLLAGYGRREFALDRQMAVNHVKDDESRCDECKNLQMQCVIVEQDRFWGRTQCAGCVQRKSQCSLDSAVNKETRSAVVLLCH